MEAVGRLVFVIAMTDVRWKYCSYFTLFCLLFGNFGASERTSEKIYEPLKADFPCFRRLNGTHQIGCASERGGNVGVVHYMTNLTDLEWLLDHGPYAPYIALIEPINFTRRNLAKMRNSKKINGVLLINRIGNDTKPPLAFSPDKTCPNQGYGLPNDCQTEWNEYGDGTLFEDWGFPIFLIQNETDINDLIINCYQKFNAPLDGKARSWPLCAAELESNMLAAKDSPTCMRRSNYNKGILNPSKVCDPLGEFNIWSSLFPTNKSAPPQPRSLIVVAARLDAFSMFESISPGGDSAVSGIVALIATAEALSKAKHKLNQTTDRNVLFLILNGEAFDYIGSSRMVYDMQNDLFPSPLLDDIPSQPPLMNLSHISHFIEFNQIGLPDENTTIWAHYDPDSTAASPEVNSTVFDLIKKLQKDNQTVKIASGLSLPPSSFQRFLMENKEIAGVVLTDHKARYTNRYYNGVFDNFDSNSIDTTAKYIKNAATLVATAVYSYLADGNEDSVISPSDNVVEDLLQCYLTGGNCTLASMTGTIKRRNPGTSLLIHGSFHAKWSNLPALSEMVRRGVGEIGNMYVGVTVATNNMRVMTSTFISYYTGDVAPNVTEKDCKAEKDNWVFAYTWIPANGNDSYCVKSLVNKTKALSPAFIIPDYDFTSGNYSTWTESVWESFSLRIFLKPSFQQEVMTLCIGIFVLLLSFGSVWFLDRSSDVLFACNGLIAGAY